MVFLSCLTVAWTCFLHVKLNIFLNLQFDEEEEDEEDEDYDEDEDEEDEDDDETDRVVSYENWLLLILLQIVNYAVWNLCKCF